MARPKLLIATGNPGKMREYQQLLQEIPFELVSLDDAGVSEEVEETGLTFAENASLKARTYSVLGGLLTLADDSGLEVDALDGEPGVRSARYGEKPRQPPTQNPTNPPLIKGGFQAQEQMSTSDQDRVRLLLHNLEGVPWAHRTARFRCVIAIATPPNIPLTTPLTPSFVSPLTPPFVSPLTPPFRKGGQGGFPQVTGPNSR